MRLSGILTESVAVPSAAVFTAGEKAASGLKLERIAMALPGLLPPASSSSAIDASFLALLALRPTGAGGGAGAALDSNTIGSPSAISAGAPPPGAAPLAASAAANWATSGCASFT